MAIYLYLFSQNFPASKNFRLRIAGQMIKRAFSSVHSPGPIRVVGPLSNSREFAAAYNCKPGSRMNPSDKCSVWWKASLPVPPAGRVVQKLIASHTSEVSEGEITTLLAKTFAEMFLGLLMLQVQKKGPPLYIGWAFDVLYFISDVHTFRVEGKYQFMTEKNHLKEYSDWLLGR